MYPADVLDQPRQLLGVLRSFWSDTFEDQLGLTALLAAKAELEKENWRLLQYGLDRFDRFRVPTELRRSWYPVELKLSEKRRGVLLLDGSFQLGDGSARLDQVDTRLSIWRAPPGVLACGVVASGVGRTELALVSGVDFWIDNGLIYFVDDPFDGPAPVESLTRQGEEYDRRALLWMGDVEFDRNSLYDCWGRAVGLKTPSTPRYRGLVNHSLDCVVGGTSELSLRLALSALFGVPVAAREETVVEVVKDNRGWLVSTDSGLYRAEPAATPVVEAGDRVLPGDPLFADLAFYDLRDGTLPDEVLGLCLGRGLLFGRYRGELVAANREEALAVEVLPDGSTSVRFPLGGLPEDVERFWADVRAREAESGRTLADALDRRESPTTPVDPTNLPPTVNPAEFFARNFLYGSCLLVTVGTAATRTDVGVEAAFSDLLRRLTPPGMLVLIAAHVSMAVETVSLGGSGTLTSGDACEPVRETAYLGAMTYTIQAS